MLSDIGLVRADLFGATSDAGPEIKWMLRRGFQLQWEWCHPHLTSAVTEAACGTVGEASRSKNKVMTNLISLIVTKVYQVKHFEEMGSLFSHLCVLLGEDKADKFLTFRTDRFMGLLRVVRRILDKWRPLEVWYDHRGRQARRCQPALHPLADDKEELVQLLLLLEPITVINTKSQVESSNQVDVLLALYGMRLTVQTQRKLLWNCQSSSSEPTYYSELTPMASETRNLLCSLFHKDSSHGTPSAL